MPRPMQLSARPTTVSAHGVALGKTFAAKSSSISCSLRISPVRRSRVHPVDSSQPRAAHSPIQFPCVSTQGYHPPGAERASGKVTHDRIIVTRRLRSALRDQLCRPSIRPSTRPDSPKWPPQLLTRCQVQDSPRTRPRNTPLGCCPAHQPHQQNTLSYQVSWRSRPHRRERM